MDKLSLQFELCKYAARVLRDNADNKTATNELLDMALTVLLQTFDALDKGFHDRKED